MKRKCWEVDLMAKKVETRYYEMLWKMLTQGATKQLESRKEGEGSELITNFSPNNVRRVILGLDGMFVQFYTNVGTGITRKIRLQRVNVDDTLVAQLCNPELAPSVYMPLDMLHRSRVFSSVEEIIVIGNDGKVPYSFANSGIDWFTRDVELVARSFKRLRCVTYLDTSESIEDFIQSVNGVLEDPLNLVTSVLEDEGKYVNIINDEKYVLRTALRPQYYEADALDGVLATYFERVKNMYNAAYNRKLLDMQEDKRLASLKNGVGTLQAVLVDFVDKVLPVYDKISTLGTSVKVMAEVLASTDTQVDTSKTSIVKGYDLQNENKQYVVLLDMLFESGLKTEELGIAGVKVLLEQLEACSWVIRKNKISGVLPRMKSLGVLGLVTSGINEDNLGVILESIVKDYKKYLDIYSRVGVDTGVEEVVTLEKLDGLDVDLLNSLGDGISQKLGFEFKGLTQEEIEKLAKLKKVNAAWRDDLSSLGLLVDQDLYSRDILGSLVVYDKLAQVGVLGFLGYAVVYNLDNLDDLINVVVVKTLNEGTDLELEDTKSIDSLVDKVEMKRSTYKELIGGYVAVRDKLSHERLLNYLESKIPEIDKLGVLLLYDEYVSRRFFDWVVESDATIPLLFAFKNTGDVIYTENTKLTSDKLLKEVFKDGSEPLEVSIDKLKYMAKFKAPKKQLADKNKSLSDMFMDAVRKVDGTNAE